VARRLYLDTALVDGCDGTEVTAALAVCVGRDCATIVNGYLTPLPRLPFINQLGECTYGIKRMVEAADAAAFYDHSIRWQTAVSQTPRYLHLRTPATPIAKISRCKSTNCWYVLLESFVMHEGSFQTGRV
jgi:hypothetical protein